MTAAPSSRRHARLPARLIVLVSGAPGTGKSSIAQPLAQALGCALLAKDTIKEALFDSLHGPTGDAEFAAQLSDAAMAILFALAAHCPRAVLDANFKPWDARQRERLAALPGPIVEIHCRCAPATAIRRFVERAGERHPAHALKRIAPDMVARYERDMGVGRVIDVNTDAPTDTGALAQRVRKVLGQRSTRA